jgi:hypothetical protein
MNSKRKQWPYYSDYYEQVGSKIMKCASINGIAIIVASAFLRRAYRASNNKNENRSLINSAYSHCKAIVNKHTEGYSPSIMVEAYIEICNIIITTLTGNGEFGGGSLVNWEEFQRSFQHLVEYYGKTDKLDASVILNIWYRGAIKKATKQDISIFERTVLYYSMFLTDIYSESDFKEAIEDYENICNIYSYELNVASYKNANLKGWLLYQQRDSYRLEPNDLDLTEEEKNLAKQILFVFNEDDKTKSAVLGQPLLLRTKILCDWIEKFASLPYAVENPISFADEDFWRELINNIDLYLALCDETNPPAAFIKYIKCVYSLVFDDGSFSFQENVRYSIKLQPWYWKRIGVADKEGQLLKFIIGTTPQRNKEGYRGKISDDTSILRNLKNIHLSTDVQKYLSEGRIRLTVTNSIPDKPVNIFFNAAGATAAIPSKESGDK